MKNLAKFHPFLVPLGLFVLSFLLRINLISKGPYHLDCLALAINAQQTLETYQLHYQFGTGYPLTIILAALFIAITQPFNGHDPVFAVNFMSVTLSSLSTLTFYLFIKNTTNNRTAFASALFFCLHPIFLGLSVYGNSHVVCVFFLLLSLYSLTYPVEKFRSPLFCLCVGLTGAARLQDMILTLPALVIFWFSINNKIPLSFRKKTFSLTLCLIGSILIAASFHLPYVLGKAHANYSSQFKTFWNIGLSTNFLGLFSPYLIRAINIIFFSTTLAGIIVAWIGLQKMFKLCACLALAALTLFWVPLLFYGNIMTSVPRFFLISVIPLCFLMGYGMDQLLSTPKKITKFAAAALCAIIVILPNATNIFPILFFRHSHALLPDWAQYVKNQTEPHALVITGDDELFFNHYAKRKTLYRPKALTRLDESEFNDFKRNLSTHLANQIPVYITSTGLSTYNPDKVFSDYILKNFELEYRAAKVIEDWHSGELLLDKVEESLYRVYPK